VRSYSIRRSFLIPLGILLLQALLLFAVVLVQGQPTVKAIILGILLIPVSGLFAESYFRRIVIEEEKLTSFRPFRQRSLQFADIVATDTIRVKKRVFLTLSSEEHFIIISNAYTDFPRLVGELLKRVPPASIADETRQMAEDVPTKSSDIISCWFGVILLAIVLVLQFI
jgi:hypothetical protein